MGVKSLLNNCPPGGQCYTMQLTNPKGVCRGVFVLNGSCGYKQCRDLFDLKLDLLNDIAK